MTEKKKCEHENKWHMAIMDVEPWLVCRDCGAMFNGDIEYPPGAKPARLKNVREFCDLMAASTWSPSPLHAGMLPVDWSPTQ